MRVKQISGIHVVKEKAAKPAMLILIPGLAKMVSLIQCGLTKQYRCYLQTSKLACLIFGPMLHVLESSVVSTC